MTPLDEFEYPLRLRCVPSLFFAERAFRIEGTGVYLVYFTKQSRMTSMTFQYVPKVSRSNPPRT